MQRTWIFLVGLLFISLPTTAQLLVDKIIPPSPNAAAIMKYCDHPIGKNTGLQKIKIPIHTIRHQDLILPINLNYHPLGVKVEEEATWAGLGWHLSAGGTVTRLIRGKNDIGIAEADLGTKALGYPFEHIKPCLDDCPERKTNVFKQTVCNGLIDSDPDVFFYDIFGMRGKFLLTANHDIHVPALTINLGGSHPMVASFTIATNSWEFKSEDGTRYVLKTRELTETQRHYFDYKFDAHSLLFDYYSDVATTSWYLDEVISPTGARVTFEYDLGPDGKSQYGTNGAHTRMNINDHDTWDVHYSHYCFPEIENVQILAENMYGDVYLKNIRYGGNTIRFEKSAGREDVHSPARETRNRLSGLDFALLLDISKEPQKLDRIVINDAGNQSSYEFSYDYFNKNSTDSIPRLHKRLKLVNLIHKADGIEFPPFKFEYIERNPLPSKESHARDLWGFYNGEEDIRNIIPSDYFNYNQPERLLEVKGRARHFSEEFEMSGLIKKIHYPTRRAVEFEYESHDYHAVTDNITSFYGDKMSDGNFNHTSDPFVSGGLRIKRLKETFPSDELIKDFVYTNANGVTSGELAITPFNHDHESYGHKSSGNHYIRYSHVEVKSGKVHDGEEFLFRKKN